MRRMLNHNFRPLATTAVLSALLLVGAMPTTGLAQTTSPATIAPATSAPVTTTTTTDQEHRDFPWGLLGLLGLAGLLGLRRRDETTVRTTGTR